MSFEKWMKEAEKDMKKKEKKDLKKSRGLISERYHDRIIQYWIGYKTIQSTKKLVWATWALAIITIILVISNIAFSVINSSQQERSIEALEKTANATKEISDTLNEERANISLWLWLTIALIVFLIFLLRYKKSK